MYLYTYWKSFDIDALIRDVLSRCLSKGYQFSLSKLIWFERERLVLTRHQLSRILSLNSNLSKLLIDWKVQILRKKQKIFVVSSIFREINKVAPKNEDKSITICDIIDVMLESQSVSQFSFKKKLSQNNEGNELIEIMLREENPSVLGKILFLIV